VPCVRAEVLFFRLQNNKLAGTHDLAPLSSLQKLYLEDNCIAGVAGLAGLTDLRELNLCRQKLPPNRALQLEPESLQGLSRSLATLKCASCELDSLARLACLSSLQSLDASNNSLSDVDDIISSVSHWPRLRDLDVRCATLRPGKTKYEDQVCAASHASSWRLRGCKSAEHSSCGLSKRTTYASDVAVWLNAYEGGQQQPCVLQPSLPCWLNIVTSGGLVDCIIGSARADHHRSRQAGSAKRQGGQAADS
jgi:hypothetical protein